MDSFLLAMTWLYGIDIVFRMVILGTGVIPQRTRGGIAFDTLIATAIFAWAVSLLVN